MNFKKAVDLLRSKYLQGACSARSGPPDTGTSLSTSLAFLELTIWRGGRDSDTQQITSPTLIAAVINTMKGKHRELGEQITAWKRGPDPGIREAGEGGFLREHRSSSSPQAEWYKRAASR